MQCKMYLCKDYGIPFQGGVRINNISLQKLSPPSFANPAPRSVRSISFFRFLFLPHRKRLSVNLSFFLHGERTFS